MKYLQLLRVKHWTKNLLIFFPAVFSGRIAEEYFFRRNILGFWIFSITASIIYIYNDIQDIEKDKLHPRKKERPLASEKITIYQAWFIMFSLGLIVGITALKANLHVEYLIVYLGINYIYNKGGKNIALLDVSILAIGYVLRLLWGGELSETGVSNWMFLTVLSAAFFLGFGKRRNELKKFGNKSRKSLDAYSYAFLDKSFQLFTTLTIVFYSLTCVDETTYVAKSGANFIWTVPVVLIICLRYNLILDSENSDGDPVEVILKDRLLIGMIVSYMLISLILLYGH